MSVNKDDQDWTPVSWNSQRKPVNKTVAIAQAKRTGQVVIEKKCK